eukprot:COSAG05_NODE_373_length_10684_cov_22.075012_14_plen_135_part_00
MYICDAELRGRLLEVLPGLLLLTLCLSFVGLSGVASSRSNAERDELLKAADEEAVAEIEALRAQRQAEYDAVVAQSSSGDASAGAQLQQELATKIAAVQQAGAQNKAAVLDFLTSTVADVNISADPATRTKAVN